VALRRPSPLAYTTTDSPEIPQFATIEPSTNFQLKKGVYERVAIRFKNGTPVLDLRFSDLEVPNIISGKARSRSRSEPIMGSSTSSNPPSSGRQANPRLINRESSSSLSYLDIFSDSGDEGPPAGSPLYNPHVYEPTRRMTSRSSGRESHMSPLAAVRELTPQFPVVPSRALPAASRFYVKQGVGGFSDRGSPALSEKVDNESMAGKSPHPTPRSTFRPGYMLTLPVGTPDADDGLADVETAVQTGILMAARKSRGGESNPAEWINYDAIQPAGSSSVRTVERQEDLSRAPLGPRAMGSGRREEQRGASSALKGRRWSRISIGTVPKRLTPAPVMTGFTRGSTHLESIVIPQMQPGLARNVGEEGGLRSGADHEAGGRLFQV
jgi:hypothetical protein